MINSETNGMKDAVVDAGPDIYDRDLDLVIQPPAGPDPPVPGSQRLIVNPFLTILTWAVTVAVVREGVLNRNLYQFIVGLGLLFLSPLLLQFHCRDCRKTGWLLDYRRHACPDVVRRSQDRDFQPWRGPGIKAQLIGWSVCLVSALILVAIALASRH